MKVWFFSMVVAMVAIATVLTSCAEDVNTPTEPVADMQAYLSCVDSQRLMMDLAGFGEGDVRKFCTCLVNRPSDQCSRYLSFQ